MPDTTELASHYGLALSADGSLPLPAHLDGAAITVVNHFALFDVARYDDPAAEPCSGLDAMLRYAAVSGDRLQAVGGRFVAQALGSWSLWGEDGPWDVLVVAAYPNPAALLALLDDPEYRRAFVHRRAAVARQRVTVSATVA